MRSDQHKDEAERLIALARTGANRQEDDPLDALLVLQLATLHAQLASVGDVVFEEVREDDSRIYPSDHYAEKLAQRTLWTPEQWSAVIERAGQMTTPVVLSREQVAGLHDILVMTAPGKHTEALERATDLVEAWLPGDPR